ncbi:MoaD/ThiS family protein [Geothrix sp. SG200]|uniref:sulfur carrier protein ThiS n=1 Tax=Geothrix sp. SG200 TaxID=2922865 RepID=UPI001FAE22CE|nr:MoaD/ThiS family protein [Geothrix sp. SG200]
MKITFKLFASLAVHLPPEARRRHRIDLEVDPGCTVGEVIRRQGVPPAQCAIVLVDGAWVAASEWDSRTLTEGQALAIWPPVAGG